MEIVAFGNAFEGSPVLAIELDGVVVLRQPIDAASRRAPQTVTLSLPGDTSTMRMRLDNDRNAGPDQDRNLQIVSLSIDGRLVPAVTFTGAGKSARVLENQDYRITGGSKWTEVPLAELAASAAPRSCSNVPSIDVGPFRPGDVSVPAASLDQLKASATAMQANRDCGMIVTGWSSATGSAEQNLALAAARAGNVVQALQDLGFDQAVTFGAPQIRPHGQPVVRIEYGPAAQ